MKIAIMQPYFFPYLSYFQLILASDIFVVYDNIKYTKRGWINRNRILLNSQDHFITLPLKKDSDYLDINKRSLADSFPSVKVKLLRKIKFSYQKAPYFNNVFPLVETCLNQDNQNLFSFLYFTLETICKYLGIKTKMVISSKINIDHSQKGQDKVIAICQQLHATDYINSIGGQKLYSKSTFRKHDINLHFLKSHTITYQQFGSQFIPQLSIIDMLMFYSLVKIKKHLNSYELT
jgi:hypothetical protein